MTAIAISAHSVHLFHLTHLRCLATPIFRCYVLHLGCSVVQHRQRRSLWTKPRECSSRDERWASQLCLGCLQDWSGNV